jgi:hypothetical protein
MAEMLMSMDKEGGIQRPWDNTGVTSSVLKRGQIPFGERVNKGSIGAPIREMDSDT